MDALVKLHRDYFVFILDTVAIESHCVGYGIFLLLNQVATPFRARSYKVWWRRHQGTFHNTAIGRSSRLRTNVSSFIQQKPTCSTFGANGIMWNTGVIVVRENAPHYFNVTNLTESY